MSEHSGRYTGIPDFIPAGTARVVSAKPTLRPCATMWPLMRGFRRIAPPIATALYLAFFGVVLIRNVVWPVGDETDVLRVAAAALPSGALLVVFPGDRNQAFWFLGVCAMVNACALVLNRVCGVAQTTGTWDRAVARLGHFPVTHFFGDDAALTTGVADLRWLVYLRAASDSARILP